LSEINFLYPHETFVGKISLESYIDRSNPLASGKFLVGENIGKFANQKLVANTLLLYGTNI